MTIVAADIARLIETISIQRWLTRRGVRFPPPSDARFHVIDPGTVTWDWCDRHAGERGLSGALAYYDLDGAIVSIGVVAADGQVTEVELWRGDGTEFQSFPHPADLWEMVPGQTYSPRG